MKQLKFFALALTALMGISLASCLNNDDNPIVSMSLLARYEGGYYGTSFKTADGIYLTPTDPSVMLTLQEGLYSLNFQYNRDEVTEDAKEIKITLLSDPVRLDRLYATPESGTSTSNTALFDLEYDFNNGGWASKICPALYDKSTLIYPALFWRTNVADEKDYKEEMAKHRFMVTYEVKPEEPSVLYLYVNHNVDDADASRPVQNTNTYEVDIRDGIAAIGNSGQKVSKIVMVGKCNASSDKMDGATEKRFEIDCSQLNLTD